MSVRLLLLLAGLGLFAVGCETKKEEPVKMPEIPAGFESKPGTGGMGGGEAPPEDGVAETGETADAAEAADTTVETPDTTTPPAE